MKHGRLLLALLVAGFLFPFLVNDPQIVMGIGAIFAVAIVAVILAVLRER